MILRFLNWTRRLGAAEYWRLRCQKAEAALDAETWRNRGREDIFVSAAVLGGRGMVGLAPRSAPAAQKQAPKVAGSNLDLFAAMSFHERAEFESEWLIPGLNEGVPRAVIEQRYLAELAGRKTLQDQPN